MKDSIPINDPTAVVVYTKLLTKTDLERQSILLSEVLKKYPILDQNGHVSEFIISFDKNGKRWEFPLATRKTGIYPKLSVPPASWLPFVAEYGLRAGDSVLFYTRRDDQLIRYKLEAREKLYYSREKRLEKNYVREAQ